MNSKIWIVFLSGEIHTDWRAQIAAGIKTKNLPIELTGPVVDHETSDDCGKKILGGESTKFWHDRKGALLNMIRTKSYVEEADILVVRFGEKFRQWNVAFEAGLAAARGTPFISIHQEDLDHALKEIDAAANGVAREPDQVVKILEYVTLGKIVDC